MGAKCLDHSSGQEIVIHADMVINASGAVSNKISGMLDIDFQIVPGKGTMVAVDHLPLGMVLNRLRTPSDGDIIVPLGGEAVVGTTDIIVKDAENFRIEPEEITQMLAAGEEMMPGYSQVRSIRAWAGVRPLQPQAPGGQDRQITRGYSLIDHETEHGVPGFVTITGGKWTTHRLMAEVTLDLVCEKLGVQRRCRTHLEALDEIPDSELAAAS
jgi:glycerol-3-phosphate dehydrogenase